MNSAGFITSLESSGRRLIRSGRPQGSNRITPKLTMKDRKSTRLNSSHLVISYAVFCLKKKKKHADTLPTHQKGIQAERTATLAVFNLKTGSDFTIHHLICVMQRCNTQHCVITYHLLTF